MMEYNNPQLQSVRDSGGENFATPDLIRQSIAVLVIRLSLVLFLVDTLYALLFFMTIMLHPPERFHTAVLILFWIAHTIKYIVMTYLILKVTLQWSNPNQYIVGHLLVARVGTVSVTEKQYDLEQLKSVSIHQDWLGKHFNYGTVTLKLAALGYSETVMLADIHNPKLCETTLARYY
jgi:uncharacterized membrane protein